MENIDQLAEDLNQDIANIQVDLGNLQIRRPRRPEDTDSDVTASDIDEEETIQNMARIARMKTGYFVKL
jgi:hypothetical protein